VLLWPEDALGGVWTLPVYVINQRAALMKAKRTLSIK